MTRRTLPEALGATTIALLLALAGNGCSGCKGDQAPAPMPVATDTPAPPPSTVQLAPDPPDAADEADGDGDARHTGGGSADITHLRACCNALAGNAASMPPPQNLYAQAAASYCQAAVASVNTPGQKDAMLAGIRSALRGVTMPAACH